MEGSSQLPENLGGLELFYQSLTGDAAGRGLHVGSSRAFADQDAINPDATWSAQLQFSFCSHVAALYKCVLETQWESYPVAAMVAAYAGLYDCMSVITRATCTRARFEVVVEIWDRLFVAVGATIDTYLELAREAPDRDVHGRVDGVNGSNAGASA